VPAIPSEIKLERPFMPEGFVLPQMAKDGTTLNQASQQRADEFGVQMLFLAGLELNVPRMMSR
jgi:hypothetical protein